MKRIEFFDGAETSTEPVIGDVPVTDLKTYANAAAYANENTVSEGSIYIEDGTVKYYDGAEWQDVASIVDLTAHTSATSAHGTTGDVVGTSDTQTLTNKTISASNNTLIIEAEDVDFDNDGTGMAAENVQAAIVENRAYADSIDSGLTTHINNSQPHDEILNASRISVGTATPSPSARVQFDSTTQGTIPWPRMTSSQRDAISSPAVGLVIFNNEANQLEVWNGTVWEEIAGSGTSPTMPEVENGYEQRTVDYDNDDFVPIVASGSNSDGRWTRFADGTQICERSGTIANVDVDKLQGEIYRSDNISRDFPVPFISPPFRAANIHTSDDTVIRSGATWIGANHGNILTRWDFKLFSATERSGSLDYSLIAIGRWRS